MLTSRYGNITYQMLTSENKCGRISVSSWWKDLIMNAKRSSGTFFDFACNIHFIIGEGSQNPLWSANL